MYACHNGGACTTATGLGFPRAPLEYSHGQILSGAYFHEADVDFVREVDVTFKYRTQFSYWRICDAVDA